MEADIRWLDDPQVFRVGQLPAHSDHPIYQDTEEAAEGRSSLVQSLDGNWEFAYSVNAKSRPVNFYRENADSAQFDTIRVPGHIELAGYDQIHYINTMYPWEGKIYRRPAYTLGKVRWKELSVRRSIIPWEVIASAFILRKVCGGKG